MSDNKQARRNKSLLKAAAKGDVELVRQLLDEGAEVDFYQETSWRFSFDKAPLICAARYGRVDVVKLLLERGAKADFQDTSLYTPLMYAANYGHLGVVNVLLDAGADASLRDKDGWKASRFAKEEGKYNIEKILLEAENSGPRQVNKPKQVNKPVQAQTPDEIVFERPFGNRLLQEVFNFKSLERISLIRKDANSDVEAITRENFSALETQPALREAFEEHVRRGGKVDESAVFPNKLLKKKLPRPE